MPFASAAFAAAVTMRLPATPASFAPPRVLANEIAFFPGASREPDTIAAMVSSRWCLVFSATSGGSGLRKARAMYALKRCMTGEGAECMFFRLKCPVILSDGRCGAAPILGYHVRRGGDHETRRRPVCCSCLPGCRHGVAVVRGCRNRFGGRHQGLQRGRGGARPR